MDSPPKLLLFFRGDDPSSRPDFGVELERRGWVVDCFPIGDTARLRGVPDVLLAKRNFSDYDVVAASEYFLTWALCLRVIFTRNAPRVIALSFNQSSQRLIHTGFRPLDWLLNRVWQRLAKVVVHSRAEAKIFAKVHGIPADRFVFSHWGYDLPTFNRRKLRRSNAPYVSMIGRNNRDLKTFCDAVRFAGVEGVLITAGYMIDRNAIEPPDGVVILADRPMDECLNYVAGSFAHLVLVTDTSRGAGHISAVSAMLLGKPQIFSDVAPLEDYLIHDFNGIAVPLGDPHAVADAIRRLRDNPELAARLGMAGKNFALEKMSNAGSSGRLADALASA